MFLRELYATGGSTQTLLFGSLVFLFTAWLALSRGQDLSPSRRWLRFVCYGGWGLVVGLGLWSDMIVVPYVVMNPHIMTGASLPVNCDRISFVSNEQIDCGVIGTYLQPTHNRDMRYWITISSDPHSAYVLPPNHSAIPALEKKVAAAGGDRAYQRLFLDGYVVYIPRGAYHSP